MKKLLSLIIASSLFIGINIHAANNYKIVTENYPPFNYEENGKLEGISTEIIKAILKKIGWQNTPIKVLQWSKALNAAENNSKTIIYSLTRNNIRENKYKWAGPIFTDYWSLYSLNKIGNIPVKLNITSLQDAKKYSIATQKGGAFSDYLIEKGFSHLQHTETIENSLKLLLDNQAQLIAASELPIFVLLSKQNLKYDTLKFVLKINVIDLYIGFNKNIPDSIVNKFKKALKDLKESDEYNKITDKYYKKYLVK